MRRMTRSTSVILSSSKYASGSLILLLLFTSLYSFAQKDAPLNPKVQLGLYWLDTEQTRKGIAEIEKAVSENPLDASLLYYQGYAQIRLGERTKALASFDKGIQVNEKEALNYAGKGYISLLEKKPAEAKVLFDKALSMTKSKNVAVLKAVAEAYQTDNKYAVEAQALLNKAKNVNDTDPEVHILLGDNFLLQNNGGLAVGSYENAAAIKLIDPVAKSHADGKAYYKVGRVYQKSKNNEVAQESFIKAITADDKYAPAFKELGEIYYVNGEAAKAVTTYETYLSLTEKPEASQYEYAFFLFMAKDYKKANEVFQKVVDSPDVKPTTLRFYGVSLFFVDDFAKSREMLERYFAKAKPEDIEANDYNYYGKALQKLKQDSLALISFEKSLVINKDQSEIIQTTADVYYKTKKYPQAIDKYKQMTKIRKTPYALDYFNLGRSYYYSEKLEQADTAFTKVIELTPDKTIGYVWEGNTKAVMEEKNKQEGTAKPYFEKVVELGSVAPEKNKKDLISAYQYLSYYYYSKGDLATAKSTYEKWLAIDPGNKDVIGALDTLKKAQAAPTPKK